MMKAARAQYGRSEEAAVLEVRGSLRYPSAQALRSFVDDVLVHVRDRAVVLDLRGVSFIDSTSLGVIARVGHEVLKRTARRAILICEECDVAVTLRSAAFDDLFVMTHDPPFDPPADFAEVPIGPRRGAPDPAELGQNILDAHRDLAALSERNRLEYRDVIASLEAELSSSRPAR